MSKTKTTKAKKPTFSKEEWKMFPNMTKSQLQDYGFGRFSANANGTLMLIPKEYYASIPNKIKLENIFGQHLISGFDHLDDDHRFGFLDYGFRVKENL